MTFDGWHPMSFIDVQFKLRGDWGHQISLSIFFKANDELIGNG